MNTQVLNIQPLNNTASVIVMMLIDQQQYSFIFSRQFEQIRNYQLQVITYDSAFGEMFKFNQHIVNEVIKIVQKFYKNEKLNFPALVGDFGTKEEALSLQKPFKAENPKPYTISTLLSSD